MAPGEAGIAAPIRGGGGLVVGSIGIRGAVERVCAGGFGLRSVRAARAALPEMVTSACSREVHLAVYRSLARWPMRHVGYQAYQVPETHGLFRIERGLALGADGRPTVEVVELGRAIGADLLLTQFRSGQG